MKALKVEMTKTTIEDLSIHAVDLKDNLEISLTKILDDIIRNHKRKNFISKILKT